MARSVCKIGVFSSERGVWNFIYNIMHRLNKGESLRLWLKFPLWTWRFECVYFIKRDSTGVIKLKILRWDDYPGLSGWDSHNHKNSYKWKRDAGKYKWCNVRKAQQIIADLKTEKVQEPINVGSPQKLEKTRKWFSPRSSREEHHFADTMT